MNWQEDPNGESYKQGLGTARSPDVQRRAAELLATLGPRVDAVNQWAAQKFGWTGNKPGFWNNQAYDPYRLDSIPKTPGAGRGSCDINGCAPGLGRSYLAPGVMSFPA